MLETLSREFWDGVPWEDLHIDDHVIIADSLEECIRRLLIWKEDVEKKRLRVNAGNAKVTTCGTVPGALAKFKQIPMRCLSYRSRQQHPLQ